MQKKTMALSFLTLILLVSCSDDAPRVDQIGIGGQCVLQDDCNQDLDSLSCLTTFKGGYCGREGCDNNSQCPEGSVCVTEVGVSYCFRTCAEKVDCNANRDAENESNCSGSFSLTEATDTMPTSQPKVCIPPSSGI